MLLNPRVDDPSAYLTLDLSGTFWFMELGARDTAPWLRASHTVEVLDLNDDDLPRARRNAYDNFLSSLHCAGAARHRGNAAELARARAAIASSPCSVVWREMQRQQANVTTLRAAFAEAPEALSW